MMKIGDMIRRKDMPSIIYKIVGRNPEWHAWKVELVSKTKGVHRQGFIDVDDDRWEEVSAESNKEEKGTETR